MKKVIVRIKGGLGNQMFCYAAARRLASVNNAELVIDNITGFKRDLIFRREYELDAFRIWGRKATRSEMLMPGERVRRAVLKLINRLKPTNRRRYIEEACSGDRRILGVTVDRGVYLDGLWQDEIYFEDIEKQLRIDFKYRFPLTIAERHKLDGIEAQCSIGVHVRNFENAPGGYKNLDRAYYKNAILKAKALTTNNAKLYIFTDDVIYAKSILADYVSDAVFPDLSDRGRTASSDMRLLSSCRCVVMANSTFSWWSAWLSEGNGAIVICPNLEERKKSHEMIWSFRSSPPERWHKVGVL